MAGMDVDSPPVQASPDDRIVQKLVQFGIPQSQLVQYHQGLVLFAKENKAIIPALVTCVLTSAGDFWDARLAVPEDSGGGPSGDDLKHYYGACLLWLQWLMFEGEPSAALKELAQQSAGQQAVCGAVWGHNDLAYRCRTCEHDPTCAICVPCFQSGNHKDHDYSIIYTSGGCCDCGDATGWKREGFCSKHRGAEQIQSLPDKLAGTVGPVVDVLFCYWKNKVFAAELAVRVRGDHSDTCGQIADELTIAVVEMLLDFCRDSESLLSFVSKKMYACCDLLDVLMRAEGFLGKKVVKKLQELLLKLIGEPLFKYEFAKAFTRYYPIILSEIISRGNDPPRDEYPLLPTFSVQIFTVPTLTPRLVRDVNLSAVLLECLSNLFLSCVGEDGHLQVNKWANLYVTTLRLVNDICYVLSHDEVSKYITNERHDILTTWMKILLMAQGMDPQKRVTGLRTEDENENLAAPFVLGQYLGNVHNLLVQRACAAIELKESTGIAPCSTFMQDMDGNGSQRHAKVGRHSEERSVCGASTRNIFLNSRQPSNDIYTPWGDRSVIPFAAAWLIFECLKAIGELMKHGMMPESNSASLGASSSCYNLLNFQKKLMSFKKGTESTLPHEAHAPREDIDSDQMGANEVEEQGMLNMADWPSIAYDVSSQEISFHIPLHRLLSLLLRTAMRTSYGENEEMEKLNASSSRASKVCPYDFFGQVLQGIQSYAFAAVVMEHPLRVRVFCAQVRAGMWRKNGNASILSAECYRSVQWYEQGLESDLFLLQCCAALAPPELFVKTVQERFGVSSYTSLNLVEFNEYEPVLVQEMLILIMQIVTERRFCGLSKLDNLKRELIHRLAIGDSTHSELVKSLPRDLSKNNQFQHVLDLLSVYSNPSGVKQGKYSLRKAYWKELDLYHPRWNSRDLQLAEERYFRFCKVTARNAQLPRWTCIFDPMSSVYKIATSKAVLEIVRAVLFHAVYGDVASGSRAPDSVLVTALHLISLALDICESKKQMHSKQSCPEFLEHDDDSWVGRSCYYEDSFPILTYSTEEFTVESDRLEKQNMLSLLALLMNKHKEENDSSYSGAKYCNISSLIESLLKKYAMLSNNCIAVIKQIVPDVISSISGPVGAAYDSASASNLHADRRAKARERQAAIMEKMRTEQLRFADSLKSLGTEGPDVPISEPEISKSHVDVAEESVPVCSLCRDSDSQSPLGYLILLQKSCLESFVERRTPSWENTNQFDKAFGLMGREESSNSSIGDLSNPVQSGQNIPEEEFFLDIEPTEVNASVDLFNELPSDTRNILLPRVHCNADSGATISLDMIEEDIYKAVIKDVNDSDSCLGIPAGDETCLSSHSVVGSQKSRNTKYSILEAYVTCLSERNASSHPLQHSADGLQKPSASKTLKSRFGLTDCDGMHISSCGHAVHQECRDRYLLTLKQRYIRRLGFEGAHIVDPDLGELLCPVCRRFANSIIPASLSFSNNAWGKMMPLTEASKSSKVSSAFSDTSTGILCSSLALSLLESTAKIVKQGKFLKAFSGKVNERIEPALDPSFRKLARLYYPHGHRTYSASERLSLPMLLWDTFRYSLISTEIAARGRINTCSAGSKSDLDSLYGELHSPSGFILSLLFRVAHSTRNLNRLDVLLRFKAMELFAGSICSGISSDDLLNATKRRATFPSVREHANAGEVFPDFQLWRQCADPVIAQDPFSSLIWVLFCLPLPFIQSSEFFFSLVHLFYVVCVFQALLTCYCQDSFEKSSFSDYLLSDVCKAMTENEFVNQYFLSNYFDPSCHPKDMVRRLTLPYLRRCALLWKLLGSTVSSSPLYGTSNMWEGTNLQLNKDILYDASRLTMEIDGLRELEDLFQIPPLELVLRDEAVHTLALKWCQHFCEEFRARKCRNFLFCTPVVPFRLMQLPSVYQDLLQRYIKVQCSDCGADPHDRALCLLCGKLCSPSWKPCCRASKCQTHASTCGAGIGVFLLIRKTTILLQRSARLSYFPSPYLDTFGEEDHEMSRGRPLYLSEERYAALTYLVASHSLDRTSEVLRQTTILLDGAD